MFYYVGVLVIVFKIEQEYEMLHHCYFSVNKLREIYEDYLNSFLYIYLYMLLNSTIR